MIQGVATDLPYQKGLLLVYEEWGIDCNTLYGPCEIVASEANVCIDMEQLGDQRMRVSSFLQLFLSHLHRPQVICLTELNCIH